jgi:hypothetical protein
MSIDGYQIAYLSRELAQSSMYFMISYGILLAQETISGLHFTSEAGESEAGASEAGASRAGASRAGASEAGASRARDIILLYYFVQKNNIIIKT